MKKVTFIKLGGAVITNKDIPMSLRVSALKRLVSEIAQTQAENSQSLYVLGHGHGSFGHIPASKYQTKKGFINEESSYGMAIVLEAVQSLNARVVRTCLEQDLSAVSFRLNNSVLLDGKKTEAHLESLLFLLEKKLLPVVCGDVIFDHKIGCTIWSTEEVFAFLANQLPQHQYQVDRIIHVTEVEGMLDDKKRVIPEISSENWPKLKKHLYQTKGIDMSGGMKLKVEESLGLAKKGITSYIISGLKRNNLYQLLTKGTHVGTKIS